MKDEMLTDKQLELTATAPSELWRNPATAAGIVAHRTWRFDKGTPGSKLKIKTMNSGGLVGAARFWVGTVLANWGNLDGAWSEYHPAFPAGGWTPYPAKVKAGEIAGEIETPKPPFLVVLATDEPIDAAGIKAEKKARAKGGPKPKPNPWQGKLSCSDGRVTINGAGKVTTKGGPIVGPTAIIAPAPKGVPVLWWRTKKKGSPTKLGEPRITRVWNAKKKIFERAIVVVVDSWPPFGDASGFLSLK